MPTILSSAEAAIRLGVSIRTLARLKKTGALPFVVMSSRRHVFRSDDVAAFITSHVRNNNSKR